MKKLFLFPFVLFLFSCNNDELKKLKNQNEYLKKKITLNKNDSIKIFNDIKNNQNYTNAEILIDSIKKNDPKTYFFIRKIVDEDPERWGIDWSGIDYK